MKDQIYTSFYQTTKLKNLKRLSCEELEDLKERFVDFISVDESTCLPSPPLPPPPPPPLPAQPPSIKRHSVMSNESSRPEPPLRTVSIRNSSSSSIYDDSLSIKSSSIYSSCNTSYNPAVKQSRSVFSIYEEEDESSSSLSSNTTTSSLNENLNKLERLKDFEIQKIESMYRSIGCMVYISQCTCDLLSTSSEQIASLLNNCWKLEISSVVPVWIFDTGYNPKRGKQLRLLFVDRITGFPLIKRPVLFDRFNKIKNPNNDKRLTFTLNNLICLIKFYDYVSCGEFFKYYTNLVRDENNVDLFGFDELMSNNFLTKSKSMMNLNNNNSNSNSNKNTKRKNRLSGLIEFNKQLDLLEANHNNVKKETSTLTITKNCISNPCAFQHINSLKNSDQHVKLIIETFNSISTKNEQTIKPN